MPGLDFAQKLNDMHPHILHMFEGTFSLEAAHLVSIRNWQDRA